jgi:hypothetical protein
MHYICLYYCIESLLAINMSPVPQLEIACIFTREFRYLLLGRNGDNLSSNKPKLNY